MRVLERQALRRGPVEGREVRRRQACVEGGARARERGAGARAVDQRDGIGLQVMGRGARALVRIGHGAAALEAPFARGNAAVDAARAGRGGGDDAGARAVEGIRHLHHQSDIAAPRAVVRIGDGFRAGHHAFARCRTALRVHVRAVQPAVAPLRKSCPPAPDSSHRWHFAATPPPWAGCPRSPAANRPAGRSGRGRRSAGRCPRRRSSPAADRSGTTGGR